MEIKMLYQKQHMSESDFQQIKDWNSSNGMLSVGRKPMSESDFQQIKDWNLVVPLVQRNYTTSESDFQQIKDWNFPNDNGTIFGTVGLNPTSNKSRIETRYTRGSIFWW